MLDSKFAGGKTLNVQVSSPDGTTKLIACKVRIDTPQEIAYYEHGGILQYVLRSLAIG
jgi:aconitate hydratase